MSVVEIYNNVGNLIMCDKSYSKGSYVPIPYIIADSYKVKGEKLWSSDSGRSLGGAYKGSLTGIFPTISFTISGTYLNYKDVQSIIELFDQSSAKVKFWEEKSSSYRTATYYFDSTEVTHKYVNVKNPKLNRYNNISIMCVPIEKEK